MDLIDRFFRCRNQHSWLARFPVGWKYLGITAALIAIVVFKDPIVQAAILVVVALIYISNRYLNELFLNILLMALPAGLVILYHSLQHTPLTGVVIAAVFLNTLCVARLLFLSTAMPLLIEAITVLLYPVKVLGLNPRSVSLSIYLMVRALPWVLLACLAVVHAHKARGIKLSPMSLITPVVLAAINYAQLSADALVARHITVDPNR